jgi:hypothetical protein
MTSKYILISRAISKIRTGDKRNPKDYPFWDRLIELIKEKGLEIKEIEGELPYPALDKLINESITVVCPDSFIGHYCWYLGKRAIVIFGQSDPVIFGHPENINMLKDRKYLREGQFDFWDAVSFNEETFCPPEDILKEIEKMV